MRNLIRVLVIGFAAVIALLAAAAATGIYNARAIRDSAATLVHDQLVIEQLLDEVQREQTVLTAAFYSLSSTPDAIDRDSVLADIDQTDREIRALVAEASQGQDAGAWNELQNAMLAFSQEARMLLTHRKVPAAGSRELFALHEDVTRAVGRLVDLSYARAIQTKDNVDRQADRLAEETRILLGASIGVALVCAVLTVRIAARVFRQMEFQTSELSRVSFRLLESQELTARRFAHELHDELGGSLTAIRTNLSALQARLPGNGAERSRIDDCLRLVDESISNVRELSQLLRPTILDDFGLDAGIHWLVTRFSERTGIPVEYKAEFKDRLPDETETHLFRIVQEALTNIARHSGATQASIHLRPEGGRVRLTIHDNGKGFPAKNAQHGGMGLSGMRARARSAGGELEIKSSPAGGVTIDVSAPLSKPAVEEVV
ncbi:MAG TPA: sensor histidine kinase [Bryobacteraceae bacterium]|nr:sensor histidine kinase [Bryobacteraceae bacterium]